MIRPIPRRGQTAGEMPTAWHVPPDLLALRGIPREPHFAYIALWQLAGCRPGKVSIDYLLFGLAMGASERSCRRWIAALKKLGLVDVVSHESRGVVLRVKDWRTAAPPESDAARPTQLGLPFESTPDADAPETIIPFQPHRRTRRPDLDRPTAG